MGDFDVIVIGAGMAGINAAGKAVAAGRTVAVVERDRVGGTCPIRGCIPTKALVRSAELAHEVGRAEEFGLRVPSYEVDFAAVMDRVRGIIDRGSSGAQRYLESLEGLSLYFGEASMEAADAVRVNGDVLRAPRVLIAAGAEAQKVPIPGLEEASYLTSDDVLQMSELPPRIVVIGGGPVGLELGQSLSRLGSEVAIVEILESILPDGEPELSEMLAGYLREEGIDLITGVSITGVSASGGLRQVTIEDAGAERVLEAEAVVLGVGRGPALDRLGLDAAGVERTRSGIAVDSRLQTSQPGVYAAGDVLGAPYGAFTHVARRLGVEMTENALGLDPQDVDPDWGPRAIFTDPEIAVVGMTEEEARAAGHEVSVGHATPSGGKARAWGEERGTVKVVLETRTRRILGAHLLLYHGADLLHPIVVAMHAPGGTADPIVAAPHIHPTLGEVVKAAVERAAT